MEQCGPLIIHWNIFYKTCIKLNCLVGKVWLFSHLKKVAEVRNKSGSFKSSIGLLKASRVLIERFVVDALLCPYSFCVDSELPLGCKLMCNLLIGVFYQSEWFWTSANNILCLKFKGCLYMQWEGWEIHAWAGQR